jgi:hypothetical protein
VHPEAVDDTAVARRGDEHGVAVTEYLGIMVAVAVLIGALISVVTPGVPRTIVDGLTVAVGRMVGGDAPDLTAPARPGADGIAATGRPSSDAVAAPADPWAAPLDDPDAAFAAVDGPRAVDRLAALGGRERRLLLDEAHRRSTDAEAPLDVRVGANQLLLAATVFDVTSVGAAGGTDQATGTGSGGLDRHERYDRWLQEDRQLIWFDPADDGRVAEVVAGRLDEADRVAVVVPGTGNDVDTFDTSTRQYARNLADTIDDLDPDADAAVVACLCYDAPDSLLEARHGRYAEEGAEGLAAVTDDIRHLAAEEATMTVMGHSYGATALGHAITDAGLTADETVSLGGPGLGRTVDSVDDLPDGAGRVWGVRHDKDPIALAAWVHGRNPDDPAFGAGGFTVGDGDVTRRWWPYQAEFHGIYLVDEVSRRNLALVTLGRADEVDGLREGRP